MTTLNQGKKKKKINYTASLQGVERAEKALRRLELESKSNLKVPTQLSRSTVTKFFQRQPV